MNNDYSHYNQPISSFSSPLQLNKNQHGDQTVNGGHEYTNQLEGQVKDTGEKIIISSQESFEELGQMDLVDSFDSPIEGEILKTKAEEPLSFDDDDFDSFDSFETDDGWGNLEEKTNIVEDKETTVIFKDENQKVKAEVVELPL